MQTSIDWDARTQEVRAQLAPLRVFEGRWSGSGTSFGEPVHGELEMRFVLQRTFFEAREVVRSEVDSGEHEDISIYSFNPEERVLQVVQDLPPGLVEKYRVEVVADGHIRWVGGPDGPRVHIQTTSDDRIEVSVWLPDEPEAAHTLRYRRLE